MSGYCEVEPCSVWETIVQDFHAYITAFMEDWNLKLALSACVTFFANLFGEDWWLIQCLFLMLGIDFMFGVICAYHFDGRLSARKLHDGAIKFLAYAVSIILVWIVQEICLRTLPIGIPVMGVYAGYQTLTEIKSVSRHLERLGVKMPALFHHVTTGIGQHIEDKFDDAVTHKEGKDDVPDTKVGEKPDE